jgi:hypothetical protein
MAHFLLAVYGIASLMAAPLLWVASYYLYRKNDNRLKLDSQIGFWAGVFLQLMGALAVRFF